MWCRNGSNKGIASHFVEISGKVGRRPSKWLDKRSGKKEWAVYGKYKLTETEKGETVEEQSQEHAHHFLWHEDDCSQRIRPDRSNSYFRVLLWGFTAIVCKCAKTSPRTLTTRELAVASRQRTVSHFLFHKGILTKHNMTIVPHAPYFSRFTRLKIKLKGRHFDTIEVIEAERRWWWTHWQNITFRMRLKIAVALRTMHTRGEWWWPVGGWLVVENRLTDGSEVVSLTRRPCSAPQKHFLVLISVRGRVNPRTVVPMEGFGKLKKIHWPNRTRTSELPACKIMPQSITLPSAHTFALERIF
jgi:hypothetical protein